MGKTDKSTHNCNTYDNGYWQSYNSDISFSKFAFIENLQAIGTRNVTVSKTDTIPAFMEFMSDGIQVTGDTEEGPPIQIGVIRKGPPMVPALPSNLKTSYHPGPRREDSTPGGKHSTGKGTEVWKKTAQKTGNATAESAPFKHSPRSLACLFSPVKTAFPPLLHHTLQSPHKHSSLPVHSIIPELHNLTSFMRES